MRHEASKPTVVFLHGLARTGHSLEDLRRFVEARGFATWLRTYPSRRMSIPDLALKVSEWIRADLGEVEVVGVTHSLGGILARHMVDGIRWTGVVMLAPPNGGSRVAARFRERGWFRRFYGPAGAGIVDRTLGRKAWPPPPAPCAVIAGTRQRALGNPTSWVTSALGVFRDGVKNDGTLAVEETRLPEMVDFATVDASHTSIMNHPQARQLVLEFLGKGHF